MSMHLLAAEAYWTGLVCFLVDVFLVILFLSSVSELLSFKLNNTDVSAGWNDSYTRGVLYIQKLVYWMV